MNYSRWASEHLTQSFVTVYGRSVSMWRTKHQDDRPTILLVHGITGDHAGMIPLAVELSKYSNCLLLELPGHGASQRAPFPDTAALQQWFYDLYLELQRSSNPVDVVCAHSFGCAAVVGEAYLSLEQTTILLNPVPRPSGMYAQYARLIMRFARFWALFYNWRLFIFLRSVTLLKANGWAPRRRVGWVSRHSRPRYPQVVYQAGLVDILLDPLAYRFAKRNIAMVVCGLDDTTAYQRDSLELATVFGALPVKFIRGGHLLPIESPDPVAHLIQQVAMRD